MANITIENLDAQSFVIELDAGDINEVKGGCPICIPLLIVGAGIVVGYLAER